MIEYIWLIVLAATILVELLTVGNLVFIWFGFGAIGAWITQLLGFNWQVQVVIFSIITLISLFLVRPIAQKYLRGEVVSTNMDRIIGAQFRLDNALQKDVWYQQQVGPNLWSIIEVNRQRLSKDTLVEVIAIEGVKLVVRSIDQKEEGNA